MFNTSWTIAHVFGIPIRIHITLLLILPLFGWIFGANVEIFAELMGLQPGDLLLEPYILGFLLGLGLFASVALHEIGHTWMALRRGRNIRSITLMILGGLADLEDSIDDPSDELKIAIVGPIVSLLLGFVLLSLTTLFVNMAADLQIFLLYLGQINIILGFFNLIPAFPSDGGRVLRAALAKRGNYLRATKTATSIGQTVAIFLAILGVFSANLLLVLVAFFLYITANQEYQTHLMRSTLADFRVQDLMTHDVITVSQYHTVSQLLAMMYDAKHTGYPVVDEDGKVVGCVTLEDVQRIDPAQREAYTVRDIMAKDLHTIAPDDDAYDALKKMSKEQIGRLFVIDEQGSAAGIITRSDVVKGFELRRVERRETTQ